MPEGGHRVPFIACWPGVIPAGTTNSNPVMTMDFFPTFAKLARAKLPKAHQIDGVDILPLLKGGYSAPVERTLHWRFGDIWAVRKGAWKLTGRGDQALTLVNVVQDMEEKTNFLTAQPTLVADLLKQHQQWTGVVGNQ
jgi:arylsulfatase A